MSDPKPPGLGATISLVLAGALFLAAPYLVSTASEHARLAREACVARDLPVIAAEPVRLARLMNEIEASEWQTSCVLARYRMTQEDLDATLDAVLAHPERQQAYLAARVDTETAI